MRGSSSSPTPRRRRSPSTRRRWPASASTQTATWSRRRCAAAELVARRRAGAGRRRRRRRRGRDRGRRHRLRGRRRHAVADGVDVVVAGFHRTFDYDRLRLATRQSATAPGSWPPTATRCIPTPSGPIPGGGSIVAAIATATGVEPETAGKPHPPMVRAVHRLLGGDSEPSRAGLVVVGDQFSTDGVLAAALGCRFAIVRSGNTPPGVIVDPPPDFDGTDFAAVPPSILSRDRGAIAVPRDTPSHRRWPRTSSRTSSTPGCSSPSCSASRPRSWSRSSSRTARCVATSRQDRREPHRARAGRRRR